MNTSSIISTWLIFLPVIGAILVLMLPPRGRVLRNTALAFSGGTLLLAVISAAMLNWSVRGAYGTTVQLKENVVWIGSLNAHYFVGADSLSMPLVLLAAAMVFAVCVASANLEKAAKSYFALLLLLLSGVLGVLLSLDLLLFAVFFELALVPFYFLIGIWGQNRKEYAAAKFFLFTLIGSVCLLVVVLGVYYYTRGSPGYPRGCLNLLQLAGDPRLRRLFYTDGPAAHFAAVSFWLCFVSFGLRLPALPLHSYLPEAHAEAPAPVSMLMASLLPAMGGYAFLRVAYPIFAQQAAMYWLPVATLAAAAIVYGGLCALAQRDLKRLLAYASISQSGYALLGIAVLTPAGLSGAVFVLVAQGVAMAMLFHLAGVLHDRAHHRDLSRVGGLATVMPAYWGFSIVGFMGSMGLPGLGGFVGQMLVVVGTFEACHRGSVLMTWTNGKASTALLCLGFAAAAGMFLTACYYVWTLQRIFLGPARPEHHHFARLTTLERLILGAMAAAMVVLGILPGVVLLRPMRQSVSATMHILHLGGKSHQRALAMRAGQPAAPG